MNKNRSNYLGALPIGMTASDTYLCLIKRCVRSLSFFMRSPKVKPIVSPAPAAVVRNKPTRWKQESGKGVSRKFIVRTLFLILVSMISTTNAYSQQWFPWETRVCEGEVYTQRTSSGQTRQRVGTKPEYCRCTAGFFPKREQVCAGTTFTANCATAAWSHYERLDYGSSIGTSWSPSPSTVFVGTQFTQTSNCGVTRSANGTKPLPDSDADGVADAADTCPATISGQSVNAQGCSEVQLHVDTDDELPVIDGGTEDDEQPAVSETVQRFVLINNVLIPFSAVTTPLPPFTSKVVAQDPYKAIVTWSASANVTSYRLELLDSTLNRWNTIYEGGRFTYTAVGLAVGSHSFRVSGCRGAACSAPGSVRRLSIADPADSDLDGVFDYLDTCPLTVIIDNVDSNGCSVNQLDSDNDGVIDLLDLCPNSAPEDVVGIAGCVATTADTDNDGVTDDLDYCSGTSTSHTADAQGCADEQKDADNDGIIDSQDPYPLQHSTQCTV